MEDVSGLTIGEDCIDLPPGFRFHPTDEEIISSYLSEKVVNNSFVCRAIGEVDLNKCEPWDLPGKAKMGENEWYFFCQRDRKYPTGMRTNRATDAGYWKATGKDKEIYKGKGRLVGMKKTLVFYKGRAPKGEKTNWVMHEYRLEGKFSYSNLPKSAKDEWAVCRVFHKSTGLKKSPIQGLVRMDSFGEDLLDYSSLPPLWDPPRFNDDSDHDFNGTTGTSTSRGFDGYQTSYFSNGIDGQTDYKNIIPNHPNINHQGNFINPPQNSILGPQISLPNPPLPVPGSANLGYLHPFMNKNTVPNSTGFGLNGADMAIFRALAATHETSSSNMKCKAEQLSNQSMVSQDTGLTSTDVNTEISSQQSKEMFNNSTFFEGLECLLNY